MKKYSYKTKYQALLDHSNGMKINEIVKKYNIISGAALISYWIFRYNNIEELKLSSMKEEEYMAKVEPEEILKDKKLKKLEQEIKELKWENEKLKMQNNVLKKFDPSWQIHDMKERMTTKPYKHHSFCEIYIKEFKRTATVKKMCDELGVSVSKYYVFKKRFNLLKKSEFKYWNYPPFIPKYISKANPNTNDMITKFYITFNTPGSAYTINKWIKTTYNVNVSRKIIRDYQLKYPLKFPVAVRWTKRSKTARIKQNIRNDLIGNDTYTTSPGQKIGIDGTWFKDLFINGKRTKLLCEIAYDWFTRKVVSYTIGESENTQIVVSTLYGISKYLSKNDFTNCIVQMDRGSANLSYEVLNYENHQHNFIISMSNSGFKHNSSTEALNGWIKEQFYLAFGNHFNSFSDFYKEFKTFIKNKNLLQTYIYKQKRGELSI